MGSDNNVTCCTVIGALAPLALPIAMIVMGAQHLEECRVQPLIPIYLLVQGIAIVVTTLINIAVNCCCQDSSKSKEFMGCNAVLNLFNLGWFIAGSVFIYQQHGKYSTEPTAANYCDGTLYLFAFWTQTVSFILLAIALVCLLIYCCCCRQ